MSVHMCDAEWRDEKLSLDGISPAEEQVPVMLDRYAGETSREAALVSEEGYRLIDRPRWIV